MKNNRVAGLLFIYFFYWKEKGRGIDNLARVSVSSQEKESIYHMHVPQDYPRPG